MLIAENRQIPVTISDPLTATHFSYAKDSAVDHMKYLHNLRLYPKQPEIVNRIWRGSRELIMIHREYGKSTMAEDVVLNDTIFEKKSFTMYFSGTAESATDHTSAIKKFIENDKLPNGKPNPLTQLVPSRGGSFKWSEDDFILTTGNRVKAAGLDKFVLGKREQDLRPTRIIIDDPVRKEVGYDADSIETFRKTILPMGGPMTRICVIGTPRRHSDLIMTLKNDDDNVFNLHYYPALYEDGTIMSPKYWLRRGSCCYDDRFPCGDKTGKELIFLHIKQKKAEVKSLAWSTEFLLKPVDDSSSIFPMNILRQNRLKGWTFKASRQQYNTYLNVKNDKGVGFNKPRTVIGCDHAFTVSDTADWSVFTVLEAKPNRPYKILDIIRKRITINQQKQELVRLNKLYKPDLVYSEENAAGVVFSQDLPLYQQHMPLVPFRTGTNKHMLEVGIPSMKAYFENYAIKVPYGKGHRETRNLVDQLFSELNGIIMEDGMVESVTKHDDMVDSLWIAVQAANNLSEMSVRSLGGFSFRDLNNPFYEEEYDQMEDDDILVVRPNAGLRGHFT